MDDTTLVEFSVHYERVVAAQTSVFKTHETDWTGDAPAVLRLLEAASGPLKHGARILEVGCGIGHAVRTMLAAGYDAWGVDLVEYWGKDAHLYWKIDPSPPGEEVRSRLSLAQEEPYALPYPDDTFDYVVSCEVFEHVDNRAAVFAEIGRVLKPGGLSVHIYPGKWVPLMEGHINVPLSPFCKSKTWLKLAAWLGFRSVRQRGMGWREVYRANLAQMQITHYSSRRSVLREARSAGLAARFAERDYVLRAGTGWTRLHRLLSRCGIGPLAFAVARTKLENMLVLSKPMA
jgi:SAM-dependent methyltransferase